MKSVIALGLVACVGLSGCSSISTEYHKEKLKEVNTFTLCTYAGELTSSFNSRNEAAKQLLKERGFYDSARCREIRTESLHYSIKRGAIEDQRRADEMERQRLINDIASEVRRQNNGGFY